MTDVELHERNEVLDFPGAEGLVAAGRVDPPSAAVLAAARPVPAFVPLRPERGRRLLVAAAVVAAVAGGAVAYPVIGSGPGGAPVSASAAAFLEDVADAVADDSVSDAPYWKVRTEGREWKHAWEVHTSYFDREGRYWGVNADGTIQKPPADYPSEKLQRWSVGDDRLTWQELGSLPTEPGAMAERLGPDARRQASALLAEAPVSPAVRAALFRVIADSPGVELIGTVKDRKGRAGTAVRFEGHPGITTQLIIAPGSGQLLERQDWSEQGSEEQVTYLEVGPAERVG